MRLDHLNHTKDLAISGHFIVTTKKRAPHGYQRSLPLPARPKSRTAAGVIARQDAQINQFQNFEHLHKTKDLACIRPPGKHAT